LNLYTYCANNPVNYNDPSGHFFNAITAAIGVAIGGVLNTAVSIGRDLWTGSLQWNSWDSWQSHGREYGGAFVTGAIGGAAVGFTGGLSLLAGVGINAGAWGLGSIAGQYAATGSLNYGKAAWSGIGGGIGYGIGRYAANMFMGTGTTRAGELYHSANPKFTDVMMKDGFNINIPDAQLAFINNRFGRGVYLGDSPATVLAERAGGTVLRIEADLGKNLNVVNRGVIGGKRHKNKASLV
jgi:hypothetical protein